MAKETKFNYRHVLFTTALTSIVLVILWFFFYMPRGTYLTYQVFMQESVSGLLVDAPVEYKGVDVGKVKSISLKNSQTVEILLNIKKIIPITQGTVATLTTRGLTTRGFTGFVYVDLIEEDTNSDPLVAKPGQLYPTITSKPTSSLSLDMTLLQMSQNLQETKELLKTILDQETRDSLKDLLQNMRIITHILAFNNQKLNTLLINTAKASNQFDPFLTASQHTMKTLDAQTLPTAYRVLTDLDAVSRTLLNLVTDINRDPSILIRGKAPLTPGPGETNENE